MAPECAKGGAGDTSSDVYSLACVAFEMLAGAGPHDADTPLGVLTAKMCVGAPTLAQRSGGAVFSEPLEQVFANALPSDRTRRPPTASALVMRTREAVTSALDGGSQPEAPRASESRPTLDDVRPRRPSRGLAVTVFVLLCATVAALSFAAWLSHRRGHASSPTRPQSRLGRSPHLTRSLAGKLRHHSPHLK